MTSQASSDEQWAAARAAGGAAATMPERRPLCIHFMSSSGSWRLRIANTHLGYYSTAVEAFDAWLLNCAEVAIEEVEADAVSAYQNAALRVHATAVGKAALRAQRDALAEAAARAYPALFEARRPAAARRPCPISRTA